MEGWCRVGPSGMHRFGAGGVEDEWDNIRGNVEAGRAGVH